MSDTADRLDTGDGDGRKEAPAVVQAADTLPGVEETPVAGFVYGDSDRITAEEQASRDRTWRAIFEQIHETPT